MYIEFIGRYAIKDSNLVSETPDFLLKINKKLGEILWGNNEKAFATIENWMTKAHDTIQLQVIDKSKSFVMYE